MAVCAAVALAAPDRSGTVGPASTSYTWDGGPGTSAGADVPGAGGVSVGNQAGCVDGVADCEETLIKVEADGKLLVTATASQPARDGIDLYLYRSDASGTYDSSQADLADGAGASTTGTEKITITAKQGYYMALVKFFDAQNETYKGTATFTSSETATASPTPSPDAMQPKPAGGKSKRAACVKKAKKIKNKHKRKKAIKRCKKH
jgi:hypothetical protein